MFRLVLVLFVAAMVCALIGLSDGGVVAFAARTGFYALIPLALVLAAIGLARRPPSSQ